MCAVLDCKPQSSAAWRGPSRCWCSCPAAGPVRAARRLPAAARGGAPPLRAAAPPPRPPGPPPGPPAASLCLPRVPPPPFPPPPSTVRQTQSSRAVPRPCCSPRVSQAPVPPGTARPGRSCRPRCPPPLPAQLLPAHARARARVRAALSPPPRPSGGGTPQPPRPPQPAAPLPRLRHCPRCPGPPSRPSWAGRTAQSRTGTRPGPSQTRCARPRPQVHRSRRVPPPRAVPQPPCAVLPQRLRGRYSRPVLVLPCSVQSPRVFVRAVQSQGPLWWAHHLRCRSFPRPPKMGGKKHCVTLRDTHPLSDAQHYTDAQGKSMHSLQVPDHRCREEPSSSKGPFRRFFFFFATHHLPLLFFFSPVVFFFSLVFVEERGRERLFVLLEKNRTVRGAERNTGAGG